MAVLPGEVRDQEGGVEEEPDSIVDEAMLAEGSVATLVGDDPDAHEEAALEEEVGGPNNEAAGNRREEAATARRRIRRRSRRRYAEDRRRERRKQWGGMALFRSAMVNGGFSEGARLQRGDMPSTLVSAAATPTGFGFTWTRILPSTPIY